MAYYKKRTSRRIPVNLEGVLVAGMLHYPAFIKNVSKNSLFTRIALHGNAKTMPEVSTIQLNVILPSGEQIRLSCREIWSDKVTSRSRLMISGLKIINPPELYRKLVLSLN